MSTTDLSNIVVIRMRDTVVKNNFPIKVYLDNFAFYLAYYLNTRLLKITMNWEQQGWESSRGRLRK